MGCAHTGDSDDEQSVRADDAADRFGELFGFYVDPDVWGSGAATVLMDAALEHLAEIGHDRAVVWTLTGAARARRVYEKTGWTETGRTDVWDRYPSHPVPELEYAHPL